MIYPNAEEVFAEGVAVGEVYPLKVERGEWSGSFPQPLHHLDETDEWGYFVFLQDFGAEGGSKEEAIQSCRRCHAEVVASHFREILHLLKVLHKYTPLTDETHEQIKGMLSKLHQ